MEFVVQNIPVTHVVVKGTTKTEVTIRNPIERVRIVQSASPMPMAAGEVSDPGDLTLLFDNQLI